MKVTISSLAVAVLFVAALPATPAAAQALPDACNLLRPAELQSALGMRVGAFAPSGPFCQAQGEAQGHTWSIVVRTARRTQPTGDIEARGLQAARQMGATVDLQRYGPITCTSISPPPMRAQAGYNTTCSVLKNGVVAAIEVTATTRPTMIGIERVRPLAEAMSRRF